MKILTVFLVWIVSIPSFGQVFHINEKNNPEISLEKHMNARINGAVRLRDIRYPDDNFDVLKPLGQPLKKISKIYEEVGETITFIYPGFEISYGALSQPEFVLTGISFHVGARVVLDDGNMLRVGNPIESYMKNVANAGINFADQEKIKVDVPGDDGVWIVIYLEDGIIKKMDYRFIQR